MGSLGAFHFEVSGRVQGVYFRKFTVQKASALKLVGWVANTLRGTVVGECQGPEQQLQEMKQWLCTEGSPYSHIEDCKISNERQLQQLEFEVFERLKNVP
uniref:Acylphosphatase n=1 Tax=Tetradesmus obliquus TaxID=3088 RepID=A0A383VSR5_TETOB|eukprot:jgi/Sobl393_1/14551/SZX68221.1